MVDGRPLVFPVNFALDGSAVVLRTDEGTKLRRARARLRSRSSATTSIACTTPVGACSSPVDAEEVHEPAEVARLEQLPLGPWCPGPKPVWLRIRPRTITGRRILPHGSEPSTSRGVVSMTLNVMVIENEPGASADAEQELRAAGHTVLSCHEPGDGAVSRAVASSTRRRARCARTLSTSRSSCAPVTAPQPTATEDGARCALVQRVPLVVAGDPVLDPYDEFATRTLGRTYDVVDACELAADGADRGARSTARPPCCTRSSAPTDARAEVTRRARPAPGPHLSTARR